MKDGDLGVKFLEYFELNPHVYALLKKFVLMGLEKRIKQTGIAFYFERLRWCLYFETEDPESFYKLNNNYRAFYARKLIVDEIVPPDFFELRKSIANEIAYDDLIVTQGFNWFDAWLLSRFEIASK